MEGGKAGEQLRPREIIESVGERGKVWRRQGSNRRWRQRRVSDKVHLTLFPHPPFCYCSPFLLYATFFHTLLTSCQGLLSVPVGVASPKFYF